MQSERRIERLGTRQFFWKMSGPRVDIYVGAERRHYRLPKDVLSHYSPYFERCFNGFFKESEERLLTLPEDNPDYFEMLLKYMFLGITQNHLSPGDNIVTLEGCIDFIEYCAKYDLGPASMVIFNKFRDFLMRGQDVFLSSYVEIVYRSVGKNSPIRKLVAVWMFMQPGFHVRPPAVEYPVYNDLVNRVEGLERDLLQVTRMNAEGVTNPNLWSSYPDYEAYMLLE